MKRRKRWQSVYCRRNRSSCNYKNGRQYSQQNVEGYRHKGSIGIELKFMSPTLYQERKKSQFIGIKATALLVKLSSPRRSQRNQAFMAPNIKEIKINSTWHVSSTTGCFCIASWSSKSRQSIIKEIAYVSLGSGEQCHRHGINIMADVIMSMKYASLENSRKCETGDIASLYSA